MNNMQRKETYLLNSLFLIGGGNGKSAGYIRNGKVFFTRNNIYSPKF
jgi:hypothetical protein